MPLCKLARRAYIEQDALGCGIKKFCWWQVLGWHA